MASGPEGEGPVTIPREFVFMDRAAIGLGGVFCTLDARLNFHRLFNAEIEAFSVDEVVPQAGRAACTVWPCVTPSPSAGLHCAAPV